MAKVHYSECPVCASRSINPLLTVKDYSVSQELFVIWQCAKCSVRFTQDVPEEGGIGPYYKSADYISHTNTDKGWINHTYQKVRKYTLGQKARLIEEETQRSSGSLLDIGCGTGAFLHTMKERGWNVTGIEPDDDARKMARQLYGLEIEEASALFRFPDHSFDAVTLWHVLEHVHDLHGYVQQLKAIIKKEGKLFIAVPNYQSVDAAIYRLQWAAYDVPRHLYHFSPKAMDILMRKNGLRIKEKKPMWFDSFYISLLSSKYRKGKTQYISSVINGVRSNLTALFNKERCSSLIYVIEKA